MSLVLLSRCIRKKRPRASTAKTKKWERKLKLLNDMGKSTEALTLVGILLMIPTFAFIIYYFLIKEKPINYDADKPVVDPKLATK